MQRNKDLKESVPDDIGKPILNALLAARFDPVSPGQVHFIISSTHFSLSLVTFDSLILDFITESQDEKSLSSCFSPELFQLLHIPFYFRVIMIYSFFQPGNPQTHCNGSGRYFSKSCNDNEIGT
jgi:hypothetical protein